MDKKRKLALSMLLEREGLSRVEPILAPLHQSRAPLSFSQERLWFLEQFEPGTSVYLIPYALRVTGPLNISALEKAINRVVNRHEVLRTIIHQENGRAVQE